MLSLFLFPFACHARWFKADHEGHNYEVDSFIILS